MLQYVGFINSKQNATITIENNIEVIIRKSLCVRCINNECFFSKLCVRSIYPVWQTMCIACLCLVYVLLFDFVRKCCCCTVNDAIKVSVVCFVFVSRSVHSHVRYSKFIHRRSSP